MLKTIDLQVFLSSMSSYLNDIGHIGYAIRPSERRKGYGKQQLSLVLEVARELEIPRVMVSCDSDNIASARTIMACGGVLTEEMEVRGVMQQTYWIDLTK